MSISRSLPTTPAIAVQGLNKRYGKHVAVDDLSFEVAPGSVFAFLGTNGAGKTTTMSCITTVLPFESGQIEVFGNSVVDAASKVRQDIGVVFQSSLLDDRLSVKENLSFRATFYSSDKKANTNRINELADLIDLGDFLDQKYGTLSGGQKRRADIARALIHDPKLIFLDEPTAGLDPGSRETVWRTIHALRQEQGLTVFLTTHYMEETEQAHEVCIIDEGRIVAAGSPARLRADYSASRLRLTVDDATEVDRALKSVGVAGLRVTEQTQQGSTSVFELEVPDARTAQQLIGALGSALRDFEFRHGTMDDVFLNVTEKVSASKQQGPKTGSGVEK